MQEYIVSKAIGIDLGTTNSVVALMNTTDTDIAIFHQVNAKGDPIKSETTPSCVWKDPKSKQITVGQKAFAQIGNRPEPISSIKRRMGTQDKVLLTDLYATPEEISSYILQEMKRQAELGLMKQSENKWLVDRAIITIPAYFDQPQIEATRKAAEMAGLTVLELLHEPVAAACYHCWETNTRNGIFLVYDLGGGTFDVSVLRCTEGEFEVLGISGNGRLGGDDIDALLAEKLQKSLEGDYAFDLHPNSSNEDALLFRKLKPLAEGVKKALSDREDYILRDTTTLQDKEGERILIDIPYERHELETLIRPLIERTLPYCYIALEQAEKKAGVTLADVDEIILAGGSTHIPLVREIVRQALCNTPDAQGIRAKCSEPVYKKVDTIVALGAAIRAAATGGVAMYNADKTVRVFFRGIGTTETRQTHLGGEVTSLVRGIDLNGGQVRLLMPDQGYEDEQDLKANGAFSFTRIPLQPATDNTLIIEVYDRMGTLVASVPRVIRQSKEAVRPTGGSTGTAKLTKAIILDVVNEDNQLYKETLFDDLTTLPAKKDFIFYYRGDNVVRFPIYQKAKRIHETQITLMASLPFGTPIPFTAEIDALANITIKGKVGEALFEATFSSPQERTAPTKEVVQRVDQDFHQAVVALPSEKRTVVESRYRHAKQSYEAAVKREDKSQAIHDFEEMEEIISEFKPSTPSLQSLKAAFDALVQECTELNNHIAEVQYMLDTPYNYNEVVKAIYTLRMQGEAAFANEDRVGYDEAVHMLESLRNFLRSIAWQFMEKVAPKSEDERIRGYLEFVTQEISDVNRMASSQRRTDLQTQLQSIRQRVHEAEQIMRTDLDAAYEKVHSCSVDLERIKNILQNSPHQADIRGLVEKKYS